MAATTREELDHLVDGRTVAGQFVTTVRARPGEVALRRRSGDGWDDWTWSEYADRAARMAAGLTGLGVTRGDRVVLMMRNRPEFHVADVACLLAGATPISIYNSSSAEQIAYLAGHCEARAAVVDGEFLGLFGEARPSLSALRSIVAVDDPSGGDGVSGAIPWPDALGHEPVDLEAAAAAVRPDDLVTVIYTSGTTGPPKGVMIDHRNVCWTAESLRAALTAHVDLRVEGRRLVSYLPMAHIAERMVSHYMGILFSWEVTTCPDLREVAGYFGQVRPELIFAVPRVWEKVYAAIEAMSHADPERTREFEEALAIGLEASEHRARDAEMPDELRTRYEAVEASTLGPVRQLLGLDALVTAISSAAPVTIEILEFFRGLGVPISEMYGMSESTGPITWEPFRVKLGSVGPAVPGVEVALGDDGEVLCRGGNVFRGYLRDPEKTAEAIDADGWLHSGDIGSLDADGYLRIVDRKKELIITAGGKNISPANLEGALKAQPFIDQACVIGDQRPFISALLVLDAEAVSGWAKERGLDLPTVVEMIASPEVRAEIDRQVAHANERFNHAEQVKKYTLLPHEWEPDSEELTPTMKLKRRGIHAKYAPQIAAMYA